MIPRPGDVLYLAFNITRMLDHLAQPEVLLSNILNIDIRDEVEFKLTSSAGPLLRSEDEVLTTVIDI